MRNIKYLLLALLLILGCKKEQNVEQTNFRIKGIIRNMPANTYVSLFYRGTDNVEKLDSMLIIDSTFVLKGKTKNMDFFYINFTGNPYFVYFIIDSADNISFSADYKQLQNYSIDKSFDSKLIQILENHLYQTNIKLKKAIANNLDTTVIVQNQRKFSLEFIEKYDTSMASIIALSEKFIDGKTVLPIDEYYDLFKKVEKFLSKNYANTPYYKQFAKFIKNYEINIARNKPIEIKKKPDKIIDFTAKDIDNKDFTLSKQKNKWILLSFGATWCQTCNETNNFLKFAENKYKNLLIVQIELDSKKEAVYQLRKKYNFNHTIIADKMIWKSPIIKKYSVEKLPTNILISPNGKIVLYSENISLADVKNKVKQIKTFE